MARYTGPVCRLCRREGQKLYLKGGINVIRINVQFQREIFHQTTWSIEKESNRVWTTVKGKAKVRRFYGIQESQMRNIWYGR